MNNNKISADLQNDIMRVLRGETKVEVPLPDAIITAARNAAVELRQLSLTEGYLSSESKKQVLRKNLNEGLEKCGCSPTTDMITRYEEEAMKPIAVSEKKEENTIDDGEIEEAKDNGLRTHLRHPKGKAVLDKAGKLVAVYRTEKAARNHALSGKPQKEEVENQNTSIAEELKNFVTNLTAEDRNTLRGLLEAQD